MRFQSFFMLMTVQPFFVASSYNAWVKVPTLVSGRPWAGPYAYSRFASSWKILRRCNERCSGPSFSRERGNCVDQILLQLEQIVWPSTSRWSRTQR